MRTLRIDPVVSPTAAPAWVQVVRWLTVAAMAVAGAIYVQTTLHWRLMVDSPVMHYVVYLMHHGLRPYVDISDNNMPGSYLTEAAAMRLFGAGDLAWRMYEFTLLGVLTASLAYLARRRDWVAGIFAVGVFAALHGAEGAQYAAERELVLATLLAVGLVALSMAVRHAQPAAALIFGLASGLAASIKPTFLLLPIALVVLAALVIRRTGRSPWRTIAFATLGFLLIAAITLGFLLHEGALGAFVFILREVLPAYAGLSSISWRELAAVALPKAVALLALAAVPLAVASHRRAREWSLDPDEWERWAVLLTSLFGMASYFVQRKGFLHHRYVFELFLLLLIGCEIFDALRRGSWSRWLGLALLIFAVGVYVPHMLREARGQVGHSDLELALEHDLEQLGGPGRLQQRVMCFDMVFGCLDALYHLNIQQETGFTGDLLFFSSAETEPVRYYRARYWRQTAGNPPEVIVLSNQELSHPDNFDRIANWPEVDRQLSQEYTLVVERHFTWEQFGGRYPRPVEPSRQDAYRIYVRNGSPLMDEGPALRARRAVGQSSMP